MTENLIVYEASGTGLNVSLHPSGPKWTVRCGKCGNTWRRRIPLISYPRFPCPHCNALNELKIVVGRDCE